MFFIRIPPQDSGSSSEPSTKVSSPTLPRNLHFKAAGVAPPSLLVPILQRAKSSPRADVRGVSLLPLLMVPLSHRKEC